MAKIKKLKENGQDIVPITHEQAVLDSNGVTLESKLATINNTLSRLENNSTSNTPSLAGNTLTFGNYTIKYNETDDTLDFLYNGAIDEPTTEEYVTDGLSMYIDATRGSISDITGNHTITNHGVTHTSDNNYLNFVASESDYLDTDFIPNLTQWSAELYFYFTSTPTNSQSLCGWGASGNKVKIYYSGSKGGISVQTNNNEVILITNSNLLAPHHLIVTMNNGVLISYLDGVKIQLPNYATVQTSHTGTLKIGTKYEAIEEFINMNLRMFRFYDGKVLSDEEALRNYNYELKNTYVTNGLSLYIDAQDVATQGSVRDITGKQSIVNHGVSTTLDNGCLNFVASESDYIDGGFKPNLTQWSAELYFYFTSPGNVGTLLSWGARGDRTTIAYWDSFMIAIKDDVQHTITSTPPTSLTHLVLTYNNGRIIAYVNGVKSQITASANVMTSQAGNLMLGAKYSASSEYSDMHLKSLRFYDGKALTDEEALQNYNYETNRNVLE